MKKGYLISNLLNCYNNCKMFKKKKITHLDCTLRDGGYYNNWDFNPDLIKNYLKSMESLKIDFVEIGFRTLKNESFKGAIAYSSDAFLNSLNIPSGLINKVGVMINGSEIANSKNQIENLKRLFKPKSKSKVSLVRIACHVNDFKDCLPASKWLKKKGYLVGFNLMQVGDMPLEKITKLAKIANNYPIDVLYFADSMGSLVPSDLNKLVEAFKKGWKKDLGFHAHDNMGHAVDNSVQAVKYGVSWVDSTVTGMGRGPGNAQTEYIVYALENFRKSTGSQIRLLESIRKYFKPLQNIYDWGTNPFYYLSGKYNIHPSYIQTMIGDQRFDENDILAVIEFLKTKGKKKFKLDTLEAARYFYSGFPKGSWKPSNVFKNKDVLILGSGPSVLKYNAEIENFIKNSKPYVISMNTKEDIKQNLISAHIACHPIRLLADCKDHLKLSQPLIIPFSMFPTNLKKNFSKKKIYDFGIVVRNKSFKFHKNYCEIPSSLVIAYALAVANSGRANKILVAGLDGYASDDPRYKEMNSILKIYSKNPDSLKVESITPTAYELDVKSIFGLTS